LAEALLEEGYFVTAIVPELPKQPGVLELRNPVLATGITQEFSVAMSERTNESGSKATLLKPKKVLNKLGPHSRLQVITAENKQEVIQRHMKGHSVVISTIGARAKPRSYVCTGYSDPARAFLPAMKELGIQRFMTIMTDDFLGPIDKIPTEWRGDGTDETDQLNKVKMDMRRVFDLVLKNQLNFTIWCPKRLVPGPRTDNFEQKKNEGKAGEVTTGMVANAIVQELRKGAFAYSRVCIN
jgi:hypothetical protein